MQRTDSVSHRLSFLRDSLVLPVAALLLFACSPQVVDQGGGTDYPNTRTVTGVLLTDDNSPGVNAEVKLVARNYRATAATSDSCCITGSTDSSGRYLLSVADTGVYNLQALHAESSLRLFLPGISVASTDDTVEVAQGQLAASGAITVALPPAVAGKQGYLAFEGTTFGSIVDTAASVVIFDSVPPGMVSPLYFIDADTTADPYLLQDSVTVVTGKTTYVTSGLGRSHIEITLNTTPAGADIAEDVVAFPLALRLGALEVPLAELADSGVDLVVTGSNYVPLPFEVESWNAAAGEAVIWVLLDTVYGNSDRQSLYLFWGADSVGNPAAEKMVFDTANGFAAVWHLDGGCSDATVNCHDGSAVGSVADTAGILGGAGDFRDSAHFAIDGLVDTSETVMLSAWATIDVPVGEGGEIISIGDAMLIRMDDTWNNKGCQGSFFIDSLPKHDSLSHEYLASEQFFAGTGWHYFTYCVDRKAMRHTLYIDGTLCCEAAMDTLNLWRGVGTSTVIGAHGNGKPRWNFNGAIDEVRVENRKRSAAWVKLCYMNQRQDDRFVTVKPH